MSVCSSDVTCFAKQHPLLTKQQFVGKSSYSVLSEEEQIQSEIMKNGPVEGAFTVYEDFLLYKSGKKLILVFTHDLIAL